MKVVICGSMNFLKEMHACGGELIKEGFECTLPSDVDLSESLLKNSREEVEGELIRCYFNKIQEADAILVANYTKKDISNYIGANTLIEMAFAHVLKKSIYLLNPIPEMSYTGEIRALEPQVIDHDLSRIIHS